MRETTITPEYLLGCVVVALKTSSNSLKVDDNGKAMVSAIMADGMLALLDMWAKEVGELSERDAKRFTDCKAAIGMFQKSML